jgi:hypothetical protein
MQLTSTKRLSKKYTNNKKLFVTIENSTQKVVSELEIQLAEKQMK